MWTVPEIFRVALQGITLLIASLGVWLTVRQLGLLTASYRDLHEWNRRKAAYDALENFVKEVSPDIPLLEQHFKILTSNDEIPLNEIQKKIDGDPNLRGALHKRLNCFEALAVAVYEGVLDERVIKSSLEPAFKRAMSQFRAYINHRRANGYPTGWIILEQISDKWKQPEHRLPLRPLTGTEHKPEAN